MAQVVVELSGDDAKLFRSYQRIIEQSRKLDEGTKRNKRSSEEAFGSQAISAMNRYAMSVLSVGSALGTVAKLIADVQRRSAELAASQQASYGGVGELAQLATSPQEMRRLMDSTRQLYMQGAAPDMGAAAALQFTITSAGMDRYAREIGELQASGTMRDVGAMVNAAAAMEAAMGADATGGFGTAVSRAFGASMGAPARAEQLMSAAALSGPQAKSLGFGAPELMAAVATLAKPAGSAERAGTFMEAFAKSIEKEGLESGMLKPGRSIEEYVGDIAALEARGTNLRTVLGGRQESITGYRLLREGMEQGTYGTNLTNILEAERTDAFREKVGYHREVPAMAAARARQQAIARGMVGGDEAGVYRNLAEAISEDMAARARERYGGFGEAGQKFGAWIDRSLGSEQFVNRWAQEATPETQELVRETLEAMRALREAATNLESATETNRQRAAVAVQPE